MRNDSAGVEITRACGVRLLVLMVVVSGTLMRTSAFCLMDGRDLCPGVVTFNWGIG